MSTAKEFFDLVSKDQDVKIELGEEALRALTELLTEKGLQDDARRALEAVAEKVAETHGFKFGEMEELSEDELAAVAGGSCTHEWVTAREFFVVGGCGTNDIKAVILLREGSSFY